MNRADFRFTAQEVAGSVADLGVMVPLVVLLIVKNGLNATAVLLLTGLLYMVTGLVFRVPIPVQPLKAVSIIAVASGLGPGVIAAAGMLMGVILLALYCTGVSNVLARVFSKPVVRGIQLGVGGLLLINGVKMIIDPHFLRGGAAVVFHIGGFAVPAGFFFGIAGGAILIMLSGSRRLPAALGLLLFGVVSGICFGSLSALPRIAFAPIPLTISFPAGQDFANAFFLLVLPQIPLTFGNSIVATADTARSYFGSDGAGVTPGALSLSLGITNVIAGLIGAAPLCHGAGGMTAHYRFGARTGAMGVIIGSCFLLVGVIFGRSAPDLFVVLPTSILGIMLVFIGVEHALLIRDLFGSRCEFFVAFAIGTIACTTGNIFIATMVGFALLLLLKLLREYGLSAGKVVQPVD